jgi:hypothetical protein
MERQFNWAEKERLRHFNRAEKKIEQVELR